MFTRRDVFRTAAAQIVLGLILWLILIFIAAQAHTRAPDQWLLNWSLAAVLGFGTRGLDWHISRPRRSLMTMTFGLLSVCIQILLFWGLIVAISGLKWDVEHSKINPRLSAVIGSIAFFAGFGWYITLMWPKRLPLFLSSWRRTMSDRFGALKRSGRKIMASKMPGDREHRLGCGIFVILLFMAIGTALLFYIYHDVTIHHGFSWNAMDGSTPEPKLLHNTQTPTEQSLPNTPNDADPDKGDAKITLDQQQPEERTGPHPAQYVSWFLAALLGTILFLMSEVVRWYPKLESEEVGGKKISFVKFLPWYIVNLIKGPIIVLVIMWLLVNINLTLGAEGGEDGAVGVGIQFGELPSIALLAIAFMLGYYSRTARVQLDIIMKWILPTAWSESHKLDTQLLIEGKTTIQPDQEADYKLSTNEVATWKVTFCENVSSIFLWADTKIPPIEPVALTNLPDVAMVGGRFYLKVTDLTVTGQSGRLHLQATMGDRVANLNIEVSSAST